LLPLLLREYEETRGKQAKFSHEFRFRISQNVAKISRNQRKILFAKISNLAKLNQGNSELTIVPQKILLWDKH
jgi:ribosomal protein L18E